MSAQLSMTYGPGYAGAEAWRVQLEALRRAVLHLGHKEVSFACDISGSQLSDSLAERERKRWAAEWTPIVLAMLADRGDETSEELARAILAPVVELSSFVLEARKEMTPEQVAAALERELRSMGDAGKAAIARAMRKERKR